MSYALSIPELPELPVKEALPSLLQALATSNRAVLEAPPGAGKTTLVPLALLEADWLQGGKVLVLEPRRLATRAAAQRMADLMLEPLGQTVGYWVRMEHVVSSRTRVEVVTEGILTRMLQEDPALEGVSAILFDEFHERSLQADLGLALALDAQAVLRPDLRIVIMSATLDAKGIGKWLQAPVIRSDGRLFPVETHYLTPAEVAAAGTRPAERLHELVPRAILKAMREVPEGDILVFLPGMAEMRRVADQLENSLPESVELHLLHGDLALSRQMAAIQPSPSGRRKIVLATSIAETSLTIEGVKIVVDGGYARVPRFMPRTGLTTLVTTPVSKAAADQRRGRAGRLGPGVCYRLWSTADQLQLPERQDPEISEADLSGLALELALWGVKDVTALQWLDAPPAAALSLARDLLLRLEAIDGTGQATAHGKAIASMGLTPRLGHLVIRGHELGLSETACALAALLAERDIIRAQQPFSTPLPDLTLRLELLAGKRPPIPGFVRDENAIRRVQEQAQHLRQRLRAPKGTIDAHAAGILTALAYPDRLAQREATGKVRLMTGQRASLPTELFSEADFYGIAHLDAGQHPRILLAAPLSKEEVLRHFTAQLINTEEVRWDNASGRVQARRIVKLGALVLEEKKLAQPDPEQVATALLQALQEKGIARLPWSDEAIRTRQRITFLHLLAAPDQWPDVSDEVLEEGMEEWLLPHLAGLRSMEQVNRLDLNMILLSMLSWEQQQELDKLAPTHLQVPSGSRIALDYTDPSTPVLAVRLQEVFGLLDTPRIAAGKVPLLMHLLSPASRPVQVTRDLRSFWNSGYFDVRKDLRGRYPKHHWPEDPLTAIPTRSIKRKGS